MADKTVGMLENVPSLHDESLIPVEQSGELMHATGKQFREFAEGAAERYVDGATNAAERAEAARDSVEGDAAKAQQAASDAADSQKKAAQSEAAAKLAANQCEASVSGVASFNGRGGHVMPQAGDYTADMVGAVAAVNNRVSKFGFDSENDLYVVIDGVAYRIPFGNANYEFTGNIIVESQTPVVRCQDTLTGRLGQMRVAADGSVGLENDAVGISDRNSIWVNMPSMGLRRAVEVLIHENGADHVYPIYHTGNKPTAADVGAVSKAGDTMTKALNITNGTNTLTLNRADFGVAIEGFLEGEYNTFRRYLGISNRSTRPNGNEALRYNIVENGGGVSHAVFHEGNKPKGSYTGNGSAVSRTIQTGGIGNGLLIWSLSGKVVLTPTGGIGGGGGTVSNLTAGESHFENGSLVLTTANSFLNANGQTYHYQVL